MKVGLFIPCYINAIYPQVGVASYKILSRLGVDVDYPLDQTCCGQPMANAGFENEASRLARRFETLFQSYDYIVGPSASCVAFVKQNHPDILAQEGHRCESAEKIYDLCEFIHDVVKPEHLDARFPHKVSLHNSCHGVRELHLSSPSERNIPYYNKLRDLLLMVKDIEVCEPSHVDECWRFRRNVRNRRTGRIRLYGKRQNQAPQRNRGRIYYRSRQLLPDAHAGSHRP